VGNGTHFRAIPRLVAGDLNRGEEIMALDSKSAAIRHH